MEHGFRKTYQQGCRCLLCRRANTKYGVDRRNGIPTGWETVSASLARQHLQNMRRQGISSYAISVASRVGQTTLWGVFTGAYEHLKKTTSERILAVSPETLIGQARVPAARVESQIRALLRMGMSLERIASFSGCRSHQLRFRGRNKTVKAEIAAKVDALYQSQRGAE